MKKSILLVGILIVAALCLLLWHSRQAAAPDTRTSSKSPAIKNTAAKPGTNSFDKTAYSTTAAASPWVVVNKPHALSPIDYAPAELIVPNVPLRANITADEKYVSKQMAPALERLAAAARTDGIILNLQSGYRSYKLQVSVYNNEVHTYGQAKADQESARPGHSEHQTGLAADLGGVTTPSCNVAQCFGSTPEGKWLAANAYRYGFIIRYTAGNEGITGYEAEPWHVRYVGPELANELHTQGIATLEQFFGITGGPGYN